MEAAPRLPMICFDLKTSPEPVSFGPKLKQYIATFYHEDPESYNSEVQQLEQLRSAAARPCVEVSGVQTVKRYYCQLRFLRSRFPMDKGGPCAVLVTWRDAYAGVACSAQDLELELMSVLYNVGALHTQLGAADSRQSAEGMKLACTHFQCAAWALQQTRELYPAHAALSLSHDVLHFMELVCLAQAQECILEKSMSDSRKCTIIAKVAAQAVDYYVQAISVLTGGAQDQPNDCQAAELVGGRLVKDWCRYLRFKAAYNGCVSLLYQGQQSEEQQKMGERVALYQAAAEKLEEARKLASSSRLATLVRASAAEIEEALAFTQDVVEGKRKAARNENEFIYHETVPEKDALPHLQGASLVRPVPFGLNDPDVSGPDIFGRLVPMEAHEASSVYSERKAELLRQTGAVVEQRNKELDEFMTSLHHLEMVTERLARPQTVPQEVVDRAAALNARPQAAQMLVEAMGKLSAVHHDVDSLLNESQSLIEKEREAAAASNDGKPTVCQPLNDLSREAAKYREALNKASESNEALHRAMTAHVANLRVLGQPLAAVDRHIPRVVLPDPQADGAMLTELRKLLTKVEEMRAQRLQLLTGLREATQQDDITGRLVIAGKDKPTQELDKLFDTELAKHRPQVALIEQNLAAQQNILQALTEIYAKLSNARKHVTDAFRRRDQVVSALIASYDAYEDLLAKANKGIDFYQKLETNVTKLLQRLRSTCRVQEEDREQKSSVASVVPTPASSTGPKLRDYLQQPRPAPLGSEHTELNKQADFNPQRSAMYAQQVSQPGYVPPSQQYPQQYMPRSAGQYTNNSGNSGPYSMTTPSLNATYTTPEVAPSIYQPSASHNYSEYRNQQQYYVDQTKYPQPSVESVKQYQYPQPYQHTIAQASSGSYLPNSSITGAPVMTVASNFSYVANNSVYTNYSQTYSQPQVSQSEYVQSPISTVSPPASYTPAVYSQVASYPNNHINNSPASGYGPAGSAYVNSIYGQPASSTVSYGQLGMASEASINYNQAVYGSVYAHSGAPSPRPISTPSANSSISYMTPATVVPNPAYNQTAPLAMHTASYNQATVSTTCYNPVYATESYGQTTACNISPPQPKQASNVDLLAGLDFNVSQVPLDPVKADDTAPQKDDVTPKVTEEALPQQHGKVEIKQKVVDEVDIERAKAKFVHDIEQLEKWLYSSTADNDLDSKWRELQHKLEKECSNISISVARCYPIRNRCPDSLPFDRNRYEMPSPPATDDYINASRIPGTSAGCPSMLLTQAPLALTIKHFWSMVESSCCQTVVCLMSEQELTEAGLEGGYWHREQGAMSVEEGARQSSHWRERELAVGSKKVTHIQLECRWPGVGFNDSELCNSLAALALELLRRHLDGRSGGPIVIHCLTGVGRSGVLCLLLWAAGNMLSVTPRLLDIQETALRLGSYRRNPLRDRVHLGTAYRALLCMARILVPPPQRPPIEQPREAQQEAPPVPHDPLSDLDPLWKLKI